MRVGELAVGVGEDNSEGGRVDSEGGREQVDHRNVRVYVLHITPLYPTSVRTHSTDLHCKHIT